ncbi:MAG: response regulator transcription factor [Firmicutes bacterium]|nr:response regulator transcription factor [Bacillota bacterium]
MRKVIKVLLVDDHAIMREGLRALLANYKDVDVVGEAQDGDEAVELVNKLKPDVVLMDIAMPGMGGIEATRVIMEQNPQTAVLALTQHEDWRYAHSLLKAGALGYVSKRALGTDLILALRTVAKGEKYIEPSVEKAMPEKVKPKTERNSEELLLLQQLTPREEEILAHIAQGETNAQIAKKLCLSVKTIEYHRMNLMSKLEARNVADLVRYAVKQGLV